MTRIEEQAFALYRAEVFYGRKSDEFYINLVRLFNLLREECPTEWAEIWKEIEMKLDGEESLDQG